MNVASDVDALIGLRREEVADGVVGHLAVAEHTRGTAGGVLAAIDATGGLACGLASLPAWTVSTSLMAVVARHDHTGPLRFDARVMRKTRARVVASVDVRDEGADDARVAHSILTASVLEPAAGPPPLTRPLRVDPVPAVVSSIDDAFGIAPGHGTTTTMRLEDHLRNRWGILHGGALALLVATAAERATARHGIATVVLHFLAPARTGPVEARCDVRGPSVGLLVHDTGHDGRVVARACLTVA